MCVSGKKKQQNLDLVEADGVLDCVIVHWRVLGWEVKKQLYKGGMGGARKWGEAEAESQTAASP